MSHFESNSDVSFDFNFNLTSDWFFEIDFGKCKWRIVYLGNGNMTAEGYTMLRNYYLGDVKGF